MNKVCDLQGDVARFVRAGPIFLVGNLTALLDVDKSSSAV